MLDTLSIAGKSPGELLSTLILLATAFANFQKLIQKKPTMCCLAIQGLLLCRFKL